MKTRLRLLIAEDRTEEATLLKRALDDVGVAFYHIVNNGGEVLDYLQRNGKYVDEQKFPTPNCLLLDVHMPKMGGFEVLEWLQQNRKYRIHPAIVFTGTATPPEVQRAYDLGAQSVFRKPHDQAQLAEILKQIGTYWVTALVSEPGYDDNRGQRYL
jgi:CheY-like chemotaxis protein